MGRPCPVAPLDPIVRLPLFPHLPAVSYVLFFFFSSRRRHTRFDCDWSSDVCSSDLHCLPVNLPSLAGPVASEGFSAGAIPHSCARGWLRHQHDQTRGRKAPTLSAIRSEERRVGKECRSRWSPYH